MLSRMDKTQTPSVAELAKATLRRMALDKLEPTPANYAKAWVQEGGTDDRSDGAKPTLAARTASEALASRLLPAGDDRGALQTALQGQQWADVSALLNDKVPAASDLGQQWADLIDQITKQMDRSSKAWTTARRRQSLGQILTSSRGDVHRLQQRLANLVAAWAESRSDEEAADPQPEQVLDQALSELAEAPSHASTGPAHAPMMGQNGGAPMEAVITPDAVEAHSWPPVVDALRQTVVQALPTDDERAAEVGLRFDTVAKQVRDRGASGTTGAELEQACTEVQRVLQLRHHLVRQMVGLVSELTDSLGEMAEDDSWVEGQCLAMRDHLEMGLSTRGVSAVSDLLRTTRLRQQQLRSERATAREALKHLIHQMLQDLGNLGEHTGRFGESVGRYAQVIGEADSLEGLAGIVREMVEETRTVHALVTQTTDKLQAGHAKATELSDRIRDLEDELRRLSREVSTDQLTQIANRRGLLTHFEVERSRVDRGETTLAIGILDIDNFKRLNDTMGHQTGDEALKFLARQVTATLRPSDTLARYGGEEFVVLLRDTPLEEAQTVLTRVQRTLSAELFMYEGRQTFVTFSAGVTLFRSGETLEAALQRADEGLYEAKRTGKNRTCTA